MSAALEHRELRVHGKRLLRRLDELAEIGAIEGGGCCRLAFSDDDRRGRDLVVGWMRELGLEVSPRAPVEETVERLRAAVARGLENIAMQELARRNRGGRK